MSQSNSEFYETSTVEFIEKFIYINKKTNEIE